MCLTDQCHKGILEAMSPGKQTKATTAYELDEVRITCWVVELIAFVAAAEARQGQQSSAPGARETTATKAKTQLTQPTAAASVLRKVSITTLDFCQGAARFAMRAKQVRASA